MTSQFKPDLSKIENELAPAMEQFDGAAPEYEFHEFANYFPMIGDDELNELAEDIRKHGLLEKITLFKGKILDGRNRYKAAKAAGVVLKNYDFKQLSEHRNPEEFVISANIRRRHLTTAQKRSLLAKLIAANPAASDRSIGEVANVSHHTVGDVRSELEGCGQIAHTETRTDSAGRQQPAAKGGKGKKPKSAEKPAASFARHLELMIDALKEFDSYSYAEEYVNKAHERLDAALGQMGEKMDEEAVKEAA
jgi:hypothetical protein